MTLVKATFLLGAALSAAAPATGLAVAASDALEVVGWPLPDLDGDAPPLAMGDDPVLGRQACPSLTRLNLAQKKSEELLLKRAVAEDATPGPGSAWRLELRTGLFWWSGAEVTSKDLGAFVEAELPKIVKARGAGIWAAPEFTATVDGEMGVIVRFKAAPPYGPFVLNGAPFYRKTAAPAGGLAFECAGLYQIRKMAFGAALVPAQGYQAKRPLPEIRLYKEGATPSPGGKRLELRYANQVPSAPSQRAPDAALSCAHPLDLPYATLILWNPTKAPTADPEFRHLLTQLVPRGPLASAGAGRLGDVASAPVPRSHPGYDPKVGTRSFDMKAASALLNNLGYRRKTAGSPRLDAQGQPLKLVIEVVGASGGPNLAEKVVADAFSAVGVATQFRPKPEGDAGDKSAPPDGVLATFALDWPRVSFLGNFHSKATATAPFWPLGDAALDQDLERYAASLTTATPDFAVLARIHRRLAALEPATVLLQHKACVGATANLKLPKGNLNQRDPDWFRQLLF